VYLTTYARAIWKTSSILFRLSALLCFDINVAGRRSYNKQGRNYDTKAKGFKY